MYNVEIDWFKNNLLWWCYLYLSIILLASSKGSSIGLVVVPPFPLGGPWSLLNARYAKYASPMVAYEQAMYLC